MKMQKVLIGMVIMFVSVSTLAANPTISDVKVQQRWPWSRLVDIDYVLTCAPGESVDIVVEAYNAFQRLNLPDVSLSGDLFGVMRGARRIVWDPTVTTYTDNGVLPELRIGLTPIRPPLYMIVDLTQSEGEAGQTEYVYESALTNGDWGTWVRNPVTNDGTAVQSVVWTGVTNDMYKTDKLVLRRVSEEMFDMWDTPTTLTKGFYASVFQVTQRQWELITGGERPSNYNHPDYYAARPVETVTYDAIRGATNSVPVIDWPETGALVEPTSFVGLLQAKTGLSFDLPTEAQWEYVCRAGTTTVFNDGDVSANVDGTNADANAWLDKLGRYRFNGGLVDEGGVLKVAPRNSGPEYGTAIVGSYLPNALGLYDTHGNVYEWCRDWSGSSQSARTRRGGCWGAGASSATWEFRGSHEPSYTTYLVGFRLVRDLP